MLLKGRNAVVYGAGGALGGAVSRAFAREGAAVFLTGRLLAPVDEVATRILVAGGTAEAAVADANAEHAVEEHAQTVVDRAGSLDISINLIAVDHIQGRPLIDLSPSDFTLGLEARIPTHFVTARAAARHMVRQRSGAILMVTATPDRVAIPDVGNFGVANAALEGLTRTLATELGRAVCGSSACGRPARQMRPAYERPSACTQRTPARRWRPLRRPASSAFCCGGCRRWPRSPMRPYSWHRIGPAR
jgi:3-oxoacyl-[acyl-carrier protein] reductase